MREGSVPSDPLAYHGSVDLARHWDRIYTAKAPDEVSWYEADPTTSLTFIRRALGEGARSVIDVGGGSSRLVDRILELDVERVAVLDHSAVALDVAKSRLGIDANRVRWIAGSVTELSAVGSFDVWHDRALLHFLTDESDRRCYAHLLEQTVPTGGFAIIATFAPDGPERCSGLDVRRYDAPLLSRELGGSWVAIDECRVTHTTPAGFEQRFQYAMFRRGGEEGPSRSNGRGAPCQPTSALG